MASNNSSKDPSIRKRTGNEQAPLPREKLPQDLQKIVDDNEESLFDQIYDGTAEDTTNTALRYTPYLARARTILLSAHRYVAYTSDIGESFRPIAHPWLIRSAYGISWAYLIGDVGHEGYKAYSRNQRILHPGQPGITSVRASDAREGEGHPVTSAKGAFHPGHVPAIEDYRSVMAQRAIFQGLASMGLPAFTIHSIVRYSGRALKGAKNTRVRTWGPIGLGLAAVPLLPYMFDQPVETAVEWTFHKAFEAIGGPSAVSHAPQTGRSEILQEESRKGASKEKEL
ncbi:MAG: hypothetical protein LQ350_007146 [Teloschistes chrysophthalmus]|nr:MAG: hypothetical protein LQ350_007146 [Niorma chrysophthalma]